MRSAVLLSAAALLALAGCHSKHVSFGGTLKYGASAEDNYNAGVELLNDKTYPEAEKFFEYVKTKYPFSKFAPLAELRIADSKFAQDNFAEAVEAYKQFVQLHPNHEDVDYAEFRQGLAHFKEAPSQFALFPPAYEKDQRQLQRASEILTKFLEKHPKSKYASEARKVLDQANARLSEHEWYVAEFYFKRKRWAGAVGRYEALVDKYPGSKHEPEALMKLAQAAMEMDEKFRARTALQKLIVKHPQDPRRPEAEKRLAELR
ncbi:MAG TPA: outer membrane protein assembly factor BamD [Anaeromyxobacter sp.]|nr:outer membrane protein assembly factor BamD [Anaeromyxobacter sp.]